MQPTDYEEVVICNQKTKMSVFPIERWYYVFNLTVIKIIQISMSGFNLIKCKYKTRYNYTGGGLLKIKRTPGRKKTRSSAFPVL